MQVFAVVQAEIDGFIAEMKLETLLAVYISPTVNCTSSIREETIAYSKNEKNWVFLSTFWLLLVK